ncbi:hypothetical protein JX265_011990 [Neoarthrinium moseri]|uniref:MARVEL domain-containing protein n=1 Tax=Neoarthrinium moseri TaxID=1658444 RepID=A0A9Q0AIX4_9PEZI|nr:hypothetical protein JX265_011990 [Neoarthrinium moseri]
MGSSSGIAGLKCLQWVFRGIQFVCSVVMLGIYSYYLATMMKGNMTVPTYVKAVEGITAVGTVYTLVGLLLVCCCAGHAGTSFIALVLDVGLSGAYIYVAVANRDGASSCNSGTVNTVYGSGDAAASPSGAGGNIIGDVGLPTFQMACRLQTVCLIASCIAILFFILSVFLEIHMNRSRHRAQRPIRDVDGEYINKSDHYGAPPQRREGKRGILGAFRRRGTAGPPMDPDMLPVHQQPGDMQTRQVATWGEVSSLHDSDRLYFNDGEDRDEHGPPVQIKPTTAPQPAADTYAEGDVGHMDYDLYQPPPNGKDLSNDPREIGRRHETRASRVERLVES